MLDHTKPQKKNKITWYCMIKIIGIIGQKCLKCDTLFIPLNVSKTFKNKFKKAFSIYWISSLFYTNLCLVLCSPLSCLEAYFQLFLLLSLNICMCVGSGGGRESRFLPNLHYPSSSIFLQILWTSQDNENSKPNRIQAMFKDKDAFIHLFITKMSGVPHSAPEKGIKGFLLSWSLLQNGKYR